MTDAADRPPETPIRRLLVANRGEVAVRIIRTCRALGIETVLAASDPDRASLGARLADRTLCIGPGPARSSYLSADALLSAAVLSGCDALHPGYGFLAEDPAFALRCAEEGVAFVGPSVAALSLLGDKVAARDAARRSGVPLLAGSPELSTSGEAADWAGDVGYPLLLKATHGGGGRGMRHVESEDALHASFDPARAEALATFGHGGLYLERFVAAARHVEVQVAGDGRDVVHLGDRDCSVQRRHQKLVEEAPAPMLSPSLQADVRHAAVRLAVATGYDNIGTVEFLVEPASGEYYFLEVNPRLQVEHGVTELVTGVDLVALQIVLTETRRLPLAQSDVQITGCAIECRINAEDPERGFAPCPGTISTWALPHLLDVRVDTHAFAGYEVPPFYDSLIAKVMSRGADRDRAIDAMVAALRRLVVEGIDTTAPLAREIVASHDFRNCRVSTVWLDRLLADRPIPGARPPAC